MKASKIFNKKTRLVALVAALGTISSASVFAATESGTMTVSATLVGGCTVSDATLAFGDISALLTSADATGDTAGSLSIACSSGTTPVIYTTSPRTLTGSGTALGNSMAFNLSQTAGAATDNLPAIATGEAITGFTANGDAQVVPIYGRVLAANFGDKLVGPYSATITISVDY